MIVKGAKRTVNYQEFLVDYVDTPNGGLATVFQTPDGTAHIFDLGAEAREAMHAASGPPIAASAEDARRMAAEADRRAPDNGGS